MKVGLTSEIITIMNQIKDMDMVVERSGWRKFYEKKKKEEKKKW